MHRGGQQASRAAVVLHSGDARAREARRILRAGHRKGSSNCSSSSLLRSPWEVDSRGMGGQHGVGGRVTGIAVAAAVTTAAPAAKEQRLCIDGCLANSGCSVQEAPLFVPCVAPSRSQAQQSSAVAGLQSLIYNSWRQPRQRQQPACLPARRKPGPQWKARSSAELWAAAGRCPPGLALPRARQHGAKPHARTRRCTPASQAHSRRRGGAAWGGGSQRSLMEAGGVEVAG